MEPVVKVSISCWHAQGLRSLLRLLLVLWLFGWARPAAAETGSPWLIPLLGTLMVAFLLAALALLGYLLTTYRRRPPRRQAEPLPIQRSSARKEAVPSWASPRKVNELAQGSSMLAVSEDRLAPPRSIILAVPARQARVCLVCRREFPSTLSTCPFDQRPLVDKETLKDPMRRDDYLDTQRSIMVCDGCGRSFDLGAKFCLYDGKPLSPQEDVDEAASGEGAMICPRCGQVYDADAYFCPDDGERLLPDQSEAGASSFGALPLVICPRCATEYPSGHRICPRDGQELLPLVGRKTGGTPIHGIGPKKKVCPTCGQRFGLDAAYCSSDGSRLLSMN